MVTIHAASKKGLKCLGTDNESSVNYATGVAENWDSKKRAPRVGLRGGPGKSYSTVDKFWARVKKAGPNECWLFEGRSLRPSGHPHFHVNGRGLGAHKYSWLLHRGPIPVGKVVCHTCDVPACVNPAHLFLGTQWDNVRDSRLKGHRRGMQKLTEEQVLQIRVMWADGRLQKDIAQVFGIAPNTVSPIVNGKAWRHLSERRTAPVNAYAERRLKHG